MKTIKVNLTSELKTVEIHTFSDWHIGDSSCKYDNITGQIEAVKNAKNAYVICNGDLMNNATKTSVSDSYAERIPPMEQIETLVKLLEPIKERILMISSGNHEDRTYKTDGIDLMGIVAARLNLIDRYAKEGGIVFLRFGRPSEMHGRKDRKMCYTIYATHGTGGGRKEGAKAIRLADMASIIDADIYIHSHTHLPMIMKQAFFRTSTSNSSVSLVEKLFVNTSAQLGYGGYGQKFEFKPSADSCPVIYLNGKKRQMSAKM